MERCTRYVRAIPPLLGWIFCIDSLTTLHMVFELMLVTVFYFFKAAGDVLNEEEKGVKLQPRPHACWR